MIRPSPLAICCFALFILALPKARADVLTCATFKARLDATIEAMGNKVTKPGALKPDYEADGAGRRFTWADGGGLSGTMNCGRADAFEDFGIAIDDATRTSDGLTAALPRFMELASTSVCALSQATPEACRALVATMTTGSLSQFKEAMKTDGVMPTGTRDYFIVAGIDAELDMSPLGISWSIGPGLSMTTDELQSLLTPKNADDR